MKTVKVLGRRNGFIKVKDMNNQEFYIPDSPSRVIFIPGQSAKVAPFELIGRLDRSWEQAKIRFHEVLPKS